MASYQCDDDHDDYDDEDDAYDDDCGNEEKGYEDAFDPKMI